ncbi:MAG TPA: amidohydrolase family protein [Casimicrobiaceae bacterium]|nr:amidohydrolase family protein [Casimicrobiaceae bacterium]
MGTEAAQHAPSGAPQLFDLHSHWGTRRGYVLRTPEQLAQQRRTWNSDPKYVSEAEMATYLRAQQVRTILDFGFTKSMPLDEVRPYHDYALEVQAAHPDVIFGNWLQIDPRTGRDGADEFRRCARQSRGFVGVCISAPGMGYPAGDPIYDPFCEASLELDRPVLVLVGTTGSGAGLPGGGGVLLDLSHPRYIDALAVRFPHLKIIAGRNPWPWADDMIAVMLHKTQVWIEFHGWSPKYLPPSFVHELSRRLKHRVMFGADYPLFTYERLVQDWRSLGLDDATLQRLFTQNAATLLPGFAQVC